MERKFLFNLEFIYWRTHLLSDCFFLDFVNSIADTYSEYFWIKAKAASALYIGKGILLFTSAFLCLW